MPRIGYNPDEWDRLKRVADCKLALTKCIGEHDERQMDIWIAALAEQLKRFADLQQLDDEEPEEV